MAITDLYQDKIMGGVQGDPDPFGYQNQINNFVIDNEDYQEIPGFNFKDAPTSLMSRIQNPQFFNNPRTSDKKLNPLTQQILNENFDIITNPVEIKGPIKNAESYFDKDIKTYWSPECRLKKNEKIY